MRGIILAMVLMVAGSAFALDIHQDDRAGRARCWTWGNADTGVYRAVVPYACVGAKWSTSESNYPTTYAFEADCWYFYQSKAAPTCAAGSWPVWGSPCHTKRFRVRRCVGGANDGMKCGGTLICPSGTCTVTASETDTSSPIGTIRNVEHYNGGGSEGASLCTWSPESYGAPPAP